MHKTHLRAPPCTFVLRQVCRKRVAASYCGCQEVYSSSSELQLGEESSLHMLALRMTRSCTSSQQLRTYPAGVPCCETIV